MAAQGDLLDLLREAPVFQGVAKSDLARLAAAAALVDYQPRQKILREGDPGESLYLLTRGTVSVFSTDAVAGETEIARLEAGRVFGEQALIPGRPNRRNASVRALDEVTVAEFPAAAFHSLIATLPGMTAALDERGRRQAMERLSHQSALLADLGDLTQAPVERRYADGERVIAQGQAGSDVYLVVEGLARVEKECDGEIRVLTRIGPGGFFGERALIQAEPRAATVIAEGELCTLEIDGARFLDAYRVNPALRELVEQLSALFQLPGQGTVSLHKGRIGDKQTVTALYHLPDGRRYAASRVEQDALFRLTRLDLEAGAGETQTYIDGSGGLRTLELCAGRLSGLSVIGPWRDLGYAHAAVLRGERLWPWERALFRARGELRLRRREPGPAAEAVICACTGRTRGELVQLLESACDDLECLVRHSGASLICGGCTPLLEELAGPADRRSCRIGALEPLTENVRRVLVEPVSGQPEHFVPGQHVRVSARVDEQRVERSYTLTAANEIMVKRERDGRFSTWLHERARIGDALRVSAPRGGYAAAAGQGGWVCLVAGIGITPALALLRGADWSPARSFSLDYSVRSIADVICEPELRAAAQRPGVEIEIREVASSGRLDAGRIADLTQAHPGADFLVCGPAAYQVAVRDGLRAAGVEDGRVHVEAFTPAEGATHRERASRWQTLVSAATLPALGYLLVAGAWPWPARSESGWQFALLWSDSAGSQWSGFLLLGVLLLGQLLSSRRRLAWPPAGRLSLWTDVHAGAGLAALLLVALHTGLSFGAPITTVLLFSLLMLAATGAVIGLRPFLGQRLPWERLRALHIVLVWPFAVLLMAHVFSVYYFP